MKKISVITVQIGLLFCFFQESRASNSPELDFGFELRHFHYAENISGGTSQEDGMLPFLNFGLHSKLNIGSAEFEQDYSFHFALNESTNYTGFNLLSNANVSAKDQNTILDLQADYAWLLTPNWQLLFGLEGHYWRRFLTYGTGYYESYSHYAIPIGARFVTPAFELLGQKVTSGVSLEYEFMIAPTVEAIFSQTVTSGDDSKFSLGARGGYRMRVPLQWQRNEGYIPRVELYYEHFGYGASGTTNNSTPVNGGGTLGSISEPASQTDNYGVNFSVGYVF